MHLNKSSLHTLECETKCGKWSHQVIQFENVKVDASLEKESKLLSLGGLICYKGINFLIIAFLGI